MTARALPSLDEPKRAFKGVWIPAEIWLNKKLSWLEKCILAEIESLDNGKGCWASNQHLADSMGITKESMKVRIAELKQAGWLTDLDPIRGGPKRLLRVAKGYPAVTKRLPDGNLRLPTGNRCSIPNSEIYAVNAGDLLGLHVEEIPIESTKEIIPPIVPQGGQKDKVSDRARDFAASFWEKQPGSKPIGVKRQSKHLREAECLLASGVSEDQVFRAVDMLRTDDFRRGWVSSLESVATKWPEISGHLNGKLRPIAKMSYKEERSDEEEAWLDYDNRLAMFKAQGGVAPECPSFPRP